MKIIEGNILDLLPPGGVLFHQVNTLGKFGAGLALQIRKRWPDVAQHYERVAAAADHALGGPATRLGSFMISEVAADADLVYIHRRQVCHLFGQNTIGRAGTGRHTNYSALVGAMHGAAKHWSQRECFFPYGMGCGLAGGNWEFVKILIEENFPNATIVKLPNA